MAKNAGYNYREAEDICAVAFVFLPKAVRILLEAGLLG